VEAKTGAVPSRPSGRAELRPCPDQGEESRVVPAAPPLGHERPEHLIHERRSEERRPLLPARREDFAKALSKDKPCFLGTVFTIHREEGTLAVMDSP
jgi:hypothetical protein